NAETEGGGRILNAQRSTSNAQRSMKKRQMKRKGRRKSCTVKTSLSLIFSLAWVTTVSAERKTFRNEGLKTEIVVTLDVQGKKVTVTWASSEYGDNASPTQSLSGEIISTPKGRTGVYMHIQFSGNVPYEPPPGTKVLQWYLRIVDHQAHLFIPMQERSYEGKEPKWVTSDVEFVPE